MRYVRFALEDVTELIDRSGYLLQNLNLLITGAQLHGGRAVSGPMLISYDKFSDTVTVTRKETAVRIQKTEIYRLN